MTSSTTSWPPSPTSRTASRMPRAPQLRRRRRAHKPSPGEIAARIAGKRAEDAAHKKGKNGKHAEVAPRELTPADVEARKRRLKTLIVLGKERGYLTYAEINDHLPDDILDAEQIEGIISMIGDMGIQVYDEAPDAETLLMSETPRRPCPPRTSRKRPKPRRRRSTPNSAAPPIPVRMYMREMGSVELLTREGEIEIAKRIEEGLKHMIMAISRVPDDGRADPRSRRQDRARTSSRSTISSTACMDFNEELDAIEDDDDEIERRGRRRPTPARIAAREPRAPEGRGAGALRRRSAGTSRECSPCCRRKATRRRSTSSCRRRSPAS